MLDSSIMRGIQSTTDWRVHYLEARQRRSRTIRATYAVLGNQHVRTSNV